MPSKPDWKSPNERAALDWEVELPQFKDDDGGSDIPFERRLEKLPFRRFGSLAVCYSGQPDCKWDTKWKPGVYLGKDELSSNSIVGIWHENEKGETVFSERRELSARINLCR